MDVKTALSSAQHKRRRISELLRVRGGLMDRTPTWLPPIQQTQNVRMWVVKTVINETTIIFKL